MKVNCSDSLRLFFLIFITMLYASGIAKAQTAADPVLSLSSSNGNHLEGSLSIRHVSFTVDDIPNVSAKVNISCNGKNFVVVYSLFNSSLQFKQLQVVASSPENRNKSQFDDESIRLLHAALLAKGVNDQSLSPISIVQQTVNFLLDMVPIGETIDNLTVTNDQNAISPFSTTSICARRGLSQVGVFDDNTGRIYKQRVIVGNPASQCLGLCGPGCSGSTTRNRVYTQECLNHDLCDGYFGTKLGNCRNEFIAAINGYLVGAKCPFFIIGNWQGTLTWNGQPTRVVAFNFFNDNTTDQPYETCKLNSNQFSLHDGGNSCEYTGVVADDNNSISGSVICNNNHLSGSFNINYINTNPD